MAYSDHVNSTEKGKNYSENHLALLRCYCSTELCPLSPIPDGGIYCIAKSGLLDFTYVSPLDTMYFVLH